MHMKTRGFSSDETGSGVILRGAAIVSCNLD